MASAVSRGWASNRASTVSPAPNRSRRDSRFFRTLFSLLVELASRSACNSGQHNFSSSAWNGHRYSLHGAPSQRGCRSSGGEPVSHCYALQPRRSSEYRPDTPPMSPACATRPSQHPQPQGGRTPPERYTTLPATREGSRLLSQRLRWPQLGFEALTTTQETDLRRMRRLPSQLTRRCAEAESDGDDRPPPAESALSAVTASLYSARISPARFAPSHDRTSSSSRLASSRHVSAEPSSISSPV